MVHREKISEREGTKFLISGPLLEKLIYFKRSQK